MVVPENGFDMRSDRESVGVNWHSIINAENCLLHVLKH